MVAWPTRLASLQNPVKAARGHCSEAREALFEIL